MTEDIKKKVNLLALLLSFEKYWSPYTLSDGSLYEKETKGEALKMCKLFKDIYGDKVGYKPDGRVIFKEDDLWSQRDIMESLHSWSKTKNRYPVLCNGRMIKGNMRMYVQINLCELEDRISKELDLGTPLSYCISAGENFYRKNALKWMAQIPNEVVDDIDDQYIRKMGEYRSLVIIADIRRSQDLMTYGKDPGEYCERIVKFIAETRDILKRSCGIYDRFTGDGFVGYFSEYMCKQQGKDFYEMMLKSCREIIEFSEPFFAEWTSTIRKIPDTEIGLAIGVDEGVISYRDINNQLFAIGDACVWATRMCAAGSKGDIVINNIPYQAIKGSLNQNNCDIINSVTKSGEHFKAFRLNIKNVNYVPKQESQVNGEPGAIA